MFDCHCMRNTTGILKLANEVSADRISIDIGVGFIEPIERGSSSDSQVIGTCRAVVRLTSCPVSISYSVACRAPHPLALDGNVVSRSPETR